MRANEASAMSKTVRELYGGSKEFEIVDKLITRNAMMGRGKMYLPMAERPGGYGGYEIGPLYDDNDMNPYYVDRKRLGDYLRENGYLFDTFDRKLASEPMVLITWEY